MLFYLSFGIDINPPVLPQVWPPLFLFFFFLWETFFIFNVDSGGWGGQWGDPRITLFKICYGSKPPMTTHIQHIERLGHTSFVCWCVNFMKNYRYSSSYIPLHPPWNPKNVTKLHLTSKLVCNLPPMKNWLLRSKKRSGNPFDPVRRGRSCPALRSTKDLGAQVGGWFWWLV